MSALTVRPLVTALVATVLLGVDAGCCEDPWRDPVDFKLETDAHLNAVAEIGDGIIIATADGQLIRAVIDWSPAEPVLRHAAVEYSVAVPLNAVAVRDAQIWAVGDEGTSIQKSDVIGDWEIVDLDTDARLLDVEVFELEWMVGLVVVGDGVLRVQDLDSGEWFTPPEPDGGWGELRAAFSDGVWVWAVGAGGVAWISTNPPEVWRPEDVGLGEVDLNAGGRRWSTEPAPLGVVGDAGSYAYYGGGRWTAVSTRIDDDLLDYAGGLVLARDGRLFEATYDGLERVDKVEGLNRGLFATDTHVVIVGEDGRGRTHDLEICPPW